MSDTPENGAQAAQQQPQVKSRVMAQYIREMSFEIILAQKGVSGDAQPEIQVQVNLDARKRIKVQSFSMGQPPRQPRQPRDQVIDGEFEDISPNKKPTHDPSGWTRH